MRVQAETIWVKVINIQFKGRPKTNLVIIIVLAKLCCHIKIGPTVDYEGN
jgi:hypothetical protein